MPTLQLNDATAFLNTINQEDAAKIYAQLVFLEKGLTSSLLLKQLHGKISELIVKQYRIVFFRKNKTLYIVDAFIKKSRKTPKRIIESAQKIYNVV